MSSNIKPLIIKKINLKCESYNLECDTQEKPRHEDKIKTRGHLWVTRPTCLCCVAGVQHRKSSAPVWSTRQLPGTARPLRRAGLAEERSTSPPTCATSGGCEGEERFPPHPCGYLLEPSAKQLSRQRSGVFRLSSVCREDGFLHRL